MSKKYLTGAICFALTGSLLAACGREASSPASGTAMEAGIAAERADTSTEKAGTASDEAETAAKTGDAALLRQKYAESLRDLIRLHEFPNGVPADTSFVEGDDFSGNQFAVCDIDQDGTEELLISYQDASMAGMVLYVFQYDAGTDAFTTELAEFPSVRFYSNGYVAADSSHNQGKGGKFLPYTLYRYDQDTDVYERVAYIDAWEKEMLPDGFPEEADVSGSGYVYYISTEDGSGQAVEPQDVSVYEALVADTYGGAEEINVEYDAITWENIEGISVPEYD